MKSISVEELGFELCQNITEISSEKFKKVAFKCGHIVKKEDINQLIKKEKESLYHYEKEEQKLHEDDAAVYIARSTFEKNITIAESQEGRVDIIAKKKGLLKINLPLLEKLNDIPYVRIATAKNMQEVEKGKIIGGTRVLPLAVKTSVLEKVNECCENCEPLFSILPYKKYKVAILKVGTATTTVNKRTYVELLQEKFTKWNNEIVYTKKIKYVNDEVDKALNSALLSDANFVVVAHKLEFEDEVSHFLKNNSTEVVTYDAPVFPGTHFMLGYKNEIPIIALPHYLIEQQSSVIDLVVPKILAGIRLTRSDIMSLAHGGLCDC